MSANQQSFAAKAEQVRLRLANMQTAAASAGSRLFSPRLAAGTRPTVSFLTPTRSAAPGDTAEDLVEDSEEGGIWDNHLYIAADSKSAFVNHHIPSSILDESQLSIILSERHTKEDWVKLLHAWNEKSLEDSKPEANPYTRVGALMVSTAVTPSRKRKAIYEVSDSSTNSSVPELLASASSLSETSSGSFDFDFIPVVGEDNPSDPVSVDDKLSDIILKWDLLVSNVNKISDAFKLLRRNFGNDVELLHDKVSLVDCRIGTLPTNSVGLEDCLTAWEGISFLQQGLSEVTTNLTALQKKTDDFEKQTSSALDVCQRSDKSTLEAVAQVKKGINDMEVFVNAISDEHEHLVNQIQGGSTSVAGSSRVVEELQRLSSRLEACEMALSDPKSLDLKQDETLSSEISSLRSDLRRIEARVPKHNNMMLGGIIFQSKVDVELFVADKMPSNGFHLFHDAVTILESLTGAFQERKDVLSEWYQSTKVGCSAQEARHIASFKTTLPHVFGHTKDGVVSPKHKLPAVKAYSDWTTFDQDSGVMNYILRGIDDLKIQIISEIHSVLGDDFPEASKLASEMHTASHYFVCQLCTFITDFVQEMSSTAESPIEEAWELVSSCVRKIFDELRRVRAAASNALAEQNPVSKCALIMWSLIQANRVQKEFLDARFRNHPSIAPVIILHVFRTRVTKIAFKDGLKRLEGRIALLEKKPAGGGGKGNNQNANAAKGPEENKK